MVKETESAKVSEDTIVGIDELKLAEIEALLEREKGLAEEISVVGLAGEFAKSVISDEEIGLSKLYAFWTMDCIIEVTHAIAEDYVRRPRHYKRVPKDIAKVLTEFRTRLGTDPNWPDLTQRAGIYGALIGESDGRPETDGESQFHQLSAALRAAAVSFAERVYDTGAGMLRQAVRDAALSMNAYLNSLEGPVIGATAGQTGRIFGVAAALLTTEKIAAVFGLPNAPDDPKSWPINGDYDGDGAYLVEEISRVLQPLATGTVSQQTFSVLQRLAFYGDEVINTVLNEVDKWTAKGKAGDKELDELIQSAYSWETAHRAVSSQLAVADVG